jgi:hypothetical protein
MVAGFALGLFMKLWRDNRRHDADREWKQHMGDMLRGNKDAMPPVGKYNYGQKMVFWAMAVSLLVLLVTGLMFWRPWFAPYFPIDGDAHRGDAALGLGRGADRCDDHARVRRDLGQGHGTRHDPRHRQREAGPRSTTRCGTRR